MQVKQAANNDTNRKQPIMLGMKRKTICYYVQNLQFINFGVSLVSIYFFFQNREYILSEINCKTYYFISYLFFKTKLKLKYFLLQLIVKVMSDLNIHFRNLHLQNLVDQNEQLRRRVSKLTEIQGYVQLLVDKLQQTQHKERALINQNAILRQQTRELQIKYSQAENTHGDEIRYVFSQHDKLIQEKNYDIAQLKAFLQKENVRAGQIDTELRLQKTNEQKLVTEYQQALLSYRNRSVQLQRDLQLVFQSLEEEKFRHSKTTESWIAESHQYKNILAENQKHISQLTNNLNVAISAKNMSQKEVDELLKYSHELQTKSKMRDQQNALAISQLRQNQANLEDELAQIKMEYHNLQSKNAQLIKQIDQLSKVQFHLKSDNQIYITDNQRLIFLLEQSDKQNNHIRQKHRDLQDYSTTEIQKAKFQNHRLRQENNILTKNLSERQNILSKKILQLKQISSAHNNALIMIEQIKQEGFNLRKQLQIVQKQLITQKKLSTQLELQRKNYSETVNILRQQLANIQDINIKIQTQNHQMSKLNHDLNRILTNPRQLNKDYVDQIDKMLKNFHEERQEQNKRHWVQKQKLKQMYQYQFKQKQMELLRQITLLQQQISHSAQLNILTERGNMNKHNHSKTPIKTLNKN